MTVDTTTPVQVGQLWRYTPDRSVRDRFAPAGEGVTAWANVAQDGTRRVFYGMPLPVGGSIGDLATHLDGGSGEQEILFDHAWPPVVAVAVSYADMQRLIPRVSGPAQPLYMSYDWTTLLTEPVNQAPQFFAWRDHLAKIAHEARFDVRDLHPENPMLRRIEHDHHDLSGAERMSVANVSEFIRGWTGQLWWEIHDFAKLDPIADETEWRARALVIQGRMNALCDVCAGDAWDRNMTVRHPEQEWHPPLTDGLRFQIRPGTLKPDLVDGEPVVTDAVHQSNVRNFVHARRWREISHIESSVPHFPGIRSPHERTPASPVVPLRDGAHSVLRSGAAAWWRIQYDALHNRADATAGQLAGFRKLATVLLMAELRPENHDSTRARQAMGLNRLDIDFFLRYTDRYLPFFGVGEAWEFGYPRYDFDVRRLVHDVDPNHLYSVAPNVSQTHWDPRVNNHVALIPEDEITRTGGVATDDVWTGQAATVALIDSILIGVPGTPA